MGMMQSALARNCCNSPIRIPLAVRICSATMPKVAATQNDSTGMKSAEVAALAFFMKRADSEFDG